MDCTLRGQSDSTHCIHCSAGSSCCRSTASARASTDQATPSPDLLTRGCLLQIDSISKWKREHAKQRILERVTAAYGHMLLVDGLFQADAHPGNILVQPGDNVLPWT